MRLYVRRQFALAPSPRRSAFCALRSRQPSTLGDSATPVTFVTVAPGAILLFTMSKNDVKTTHHVTNRQPLGSSTRSRERIHFLSGREKLMQLVDRNPGFKIQTGGARRDRTDDLLLAKQALSQLSYGPFRHQGSVVRYQEVLFLMPDY